MTPQGSDPFSPKEGTGFANLIGSNIQSVHDVLDAVALFVQDCSDQIRAFDKANFAPPDERLQSATILQVIELEPDGFEIWIGITNAAGTQTTVVLPAIAKR